MFSLNKIIEMCEAHGKFRYSPYVNQVLVWKKMLKFEISKHLSAKVAHAVPEKKTPLERNTL
jgi:hypothetical protein